MGEFTPKEDIECNCSLPADICKRIRVLMAQPKSCCLSDIFNDNQAYYVEPLWFKKCTTKQYQFSGKPVLNPRASESAIEHDNKERMNKVLKSFVDWVNEWTETGENNLQFEKVESFFEKIMPDE